MSHLARHVASRSPFDPWPGKLAYHFTSSSMHFPQIPIAVAAVFFLFVLDIAAAEEIRSLEFDAGQEESI